MKLTFTLFIILTACAGFAQTTISGKVTDDKGESIPGANIIIEGTYDGTTSTAEGSFQVTTTETGTKTLIITFVGFKEYKQTIFLNGTAISVEATLGEAINELEAVSITAGAFMASDEKRRTIFRAVDIATTAGATADIAGALNTLPGTQKNGESGRLFVRGGDGNEARTFIDGMMVLDAYSASAPNTPSRGRFLPFMFKGTSFSTGGYSAEYGQALSSALVLDSKDESDATRTDIGILSVGGDVAHTQAWNGGSAAGKIQYTNLRPYVGLINQEIDWKTPPASIEGVAALRQKIGKAGIVKVYGNFNNAAFSMYSHDIDNPESKSLYDLTNNYRYLNGFYKDVINENWAIRGGLSYTSIRNEVALEAMTINEIEKGIHVKTVLEGSLSDKVEIKSGMEIINRDYVQAFTPKDNTGYSRVFNETITAAFTEVDVFTSNNFVARAGGRAEHNSLINQFSFDPRVSMAYKTGDHAQVSFAYGKFRQSAKNQYVRVNTNLDAEKAEHFILNYQLVENKRTFRIETYYKKYNDLVKFVDGNGDDLNNAGFGYAKGIELFWRDNRSVRNTDYWISYSYLDTKRDYLNYPYKATPTFASSHNISLVGKYYVQSLKSHLGATFSITTGRPYNNPNEERFNGSKTPTYQDLSFNWSYLPKPNLIVFFSCTNILGRDNIFGYEYSANMNNDGLYNGRAIRQAAPRFVFVGVFITFSKDKSVNQLPTL